MTNKMATIATINMPPALKLYAASLGHNPDDCELQPLYRKVKILEKNFLSVDYVETLVKNEDGADSVIYSAPIRTDIRMCIHDDIRQAFAAFTAHVLFINNLVSDDKYNFLQSIIVDNFEDVYTDFEQRSAGDFEIKMLNRVSVIGLQFSGFGDNEAVSIVYKMKNYLGKESASITPLVQFDNLDEKYPFCQHLCKAVNDIKQELDKYLYGGKVGEVSNGQYEIDFNNNQD